MKSTGMLQKDGNPSNQQLRHVKEVLQLFSIMTDDNRFEEIYNEELKKKEELRQCVMYWIVQ